MILKTLPIIHFLFGALALFLVLELVDCFFGLVFTIPFATAVASVVLIRRSRVGVLARVQLVMTLLAALAVVGEGWLSSRNCPATVIWPWLVGVVLLIGLVLPWIVFTVFHLMEMYSRRDQAEGGFRPGLPAHALMAVTLTASDDGGAGISGGQHRRICGRADGVVSRAAGGTAAVQCLAAGGQCQRGGAVGAGAGQNLQPLNRTPVALRRCRTFQFERDTRAESGHFDGR